MKRETLIITLKGDLDAEASIILDSALYQAIKEQRCPIWIDCHKLTYISSAGLGVFISYRQLLKEKGIPLVLFALEARLKSVFQLLGLDKYIPIVRNSAEARRFCQTRLGFSYFRKKRGEK
jgi:anti-sigma B factor antagonist